MVLWLQETTYKPKQATQNSTICKYKKENFPSGCRQIKVLQIERSMQETGNKILT